MYRKEFRLDESHPDPWEAGRTLAQNLKGDWTVIEDVRADELWLAIEVEE